MLIAASTHHPWQELSWWVNWISIIGLPLTLIGLALTWIQAKNAVKAAKAAQIATTRTAQAIRAKQLMLLVPQLSQTVREFDSAIESDSFAHARRDLERWRWQATSIHGILSAAEESERRLLKVVQTSIALAQTADRVLRDRKEGISMSCAQVYEAMIIACDSLNAWVGKYAIEAPQSEASEESS